MNKKKFNFKDFTVTGALGLSAGAFAQEGANNRAFRDKVETFEKDLESLKDDTLDIAAKEEIKARIRIQFEVLKMMIAKTVMEIELPLHRA